MYSKIKIFGHPLHAILVAYPVAFYTSTFISFILFALNGNQFCYDFGYVSNIIGISSAAIAALPGFIDWAIGIPNDIPAKSRGMKHMILNVLALTLFISNVVVHTKEDTSPNMTVALGLTGAGLACTLVAAFLGGELMQKDHVGIILTAEQEKLEPANKK
jgi:uncharacterized membrane protein